MLSTKDAALALNESKNKILGLIHKGLLVAKKVGRSYSIDPVSVQQYKDLAQNNDRVFATKEGAKWGTLDTHDSVIKLCDNNITKFWNEHCENLSKNIPLNPLETNMVDRFTKHVRLEGKMPNISPMIYAKNCMEYIKTSTKCDTYHVFPPKNIKNIWLMWERESSRIYNITTNWLAGTPNSEYFDKRQVRDIIIALLEKNNDRNETFPRTTLEETIYEALLAYQRYKKYLRKGKERKLERFSGAFAVDGRSITNGLIYPKVTESILGIKKAQPIEKLKSIVTKRICRVCYDSTKNCFFIRVPVDLKQHQIVKKPFVSLDPGIRTFMTYYDGENYGEIGAGFAKSMRSLMYRADTLQSKINNTKSNYKKKRYQAAKNRATRKITNKVKDLHYKTAKFLGQYENIFLPKFHVKPLAEKLGSQTTRELYALAHYNFKKHLAFKTAEFGNRVIICNEAYTSKTCTVCGKIHPDLGADKVYTCSCGACHGRDYNGARNIMLRALTFGLTHAEHINGR